ALQEAALAARKDLHRPARTEGTAQGAAQHRPVEAAADKRLGRTRAFRCAARICGQRRTLSPPAEGKAPREARARGPGRACAGLLRLSSGARLARYRRVARAGYFRARWLKLQQAAV